MSDAQREADADSLCAAIAAHADTLRQAAGGRRLRIQDASFTLFGRGRNTIYRVTRQFDWFLKLPRTGEPKAMAHERAGSRMIGRALAHRREYGGASVIRVSIAPPYVLAAAIPGDPMHRVVQTESWIPGAATAVRLEDTFSTLGTLMAALHTSTPPGEDMPPASTRPFSVVRGLLDRAPVTPIVRRISDWYTSHAREDSGPGFIHGNLRLDNVLRVGSRVGFIDFENSGTGSFYQDLSRPVAELLLTRSLIAFPRERTTRNINACLGSYRQVRPYEREPLWDFVVARLARYYLESRSTGMFRGRIGSLPVMGRKLETLVLSAIAEGPEGAAPDLAI